MTDSGAPTEPSNATADLITSLDAAAAKPTLARLGEVCRLLSIAMASDQGLARDATSRSAPEVALYKENSQDQVDPAASQRGRHWLDAGDGAGSWGDWAEAPLGQQEGS
jgi:hypothetical protein